MPNIRIFDNKENIAPTDRGASALAQAGRRIGANYAEAGGAIAAEGQRFASALTTAGDVAVKFVEHKEISAGAAEYAKVNEALTKSWNDRAKAADPNDPTVAEKFRTEVLEPTLEKYSQGFISEGGKKFAEAHARSIRDHMYTKTSADMSTLAANAVSVNVKQAANSLSNTAMSDPSSVPHLLKSADSTVGGMVDSSPNLTGVVAANAKIKVTDEMKATIVKAGAVGAIQQSADPEKTAEEWGKRYPQYINGAELKQLGNEARRQLRADRMDRAYAEHLAKVAKQDKSDQAEEGYLKKLYSGDEGERASVSTKAIVNDPALTRTAKERFINIVERETKPETAAKISNVNAVDLLERMRLPEGDPRRISSLDAIYDARIGGKLNNTDFQSLKKEFTDLRTPEGERLGRSTEDFIKAVGPAIDKSNPLMGKIDQDGKLNIYRMQIDLKRKIDEYRKAGKNPYDLLDPSKPDYFGRPEALQQYQKSLQQSLRDNALRLRGVGVPPPPGAASAPPRPAPPARKPNETPEQYLNRTGR